ncbi:MAG: hypothetical protein RIQ59_1737 [Bacteroidota bacterium]|jgi:hypothetical protein
MKKNYFYFLLFVPLLIQSQNILWEKSYGGKYADYLFDVQPTADYGFILAGSSLSDKSGTKSENNQGDLDYWVWKMDENGKPDWQKSLGGSGFDLLKSIRGTKDGGFILAGTSNSDTGFHKKDSCKGGTDFWVFKLNAKGEEQWQRTIGGTGQDELLSVFQTTDGGYILGGSSSSDATIVATTGKKALTTSKKDLTSKSTSSRGSMDYWIVKLNAEGEVQWQKTFGGKYVDELRSMEQTKDGGYILGGYSNSPESGDKTEPSIGIGDYWVVKIDNSGTIEWQRTYGGNGDNQLYVIHQTGDEGYLIGGNSNSTNSLTTKGGTVSNGTDFWLLKVDTKGEEQWSRTYDYGKVDILTSLVENKDHTFLIGGYAQNDVTSASGLALKKQDKGINDYIALKVDATGQEIWTQSVGSSGEDILRKLIETRDGGYLLAGTSNSSSSLDKKSTIGSNDFWVVKLQDKVNVEPAKVAIEVFPNPVATFTNVIIGYEYTNGTATLVDLSGRTLQQFSITSRTVPLDLTMYPEGIYIVNIKTDVRTDGLKLIKKTKKE